MVLIRTGDPIRPMRRDKAVKKGLWLRGVFSTKQEKCLARGGGLLRTHGMSDDSLRKIYKAVVLAKLIYASPAWWGVYGGFRQAAD